MHRSCFLFGHADTPWSVLPKLERAIDRETAAGIINFFVGYHGSFDRIAAKALQSAKRKHPEITTNLLLAYHPAEIRIDTPTGFDGTYYPPLENVPRKFALIRANRYMISTADSILCYVHHVGNTRELLTYAIRQASHRELRITNLADSSD